jgi:4-hydroxy-tetrahydrodipicolinate synthase
MTGLDAQEYASEVCGATDLPVMVYNNPLRTAFDLGTDGLEALATRNPTVRAVKEAGDPNRAGETKKRLGTGFQVFSGHDRAFADHWALGYDGLTSVAGNLWPREMGAVVTALAGGRPDEARTRLAGLPLQAVIEVQLPASLKLALRLRSLPGGWCRQPLGHLEPGAERELARQLAGSPLG